MRTLIIKASPRKQGNTFSLINEFVQNLDGDVQIVNTYYDNVKPCLDCRYCWNHPKCAIDDDMQQVYEWLNEVDHVIIASPLYFSELTGSILNFASRLQYLYVSRSIRKDVNFQLKGKQGALILVGGGDTIDTSKAEGTAHTLFKHMNVKSIGTVLSLHTDSIGDIMGTLAKDDRKAIRRVQELASILNLTD